MRMQEKWKELVAAIKNTPQCVEAIVIKSIGDCGVNDGIKDSISDKWKP